MQITRLSIFRCLQVLQVFGNSATFLTFLGLINRAYSPFPAQQSALYFWIRLRDAFPLVLWDLANEHSLPTLFMVNTAIPPSNNLVALLDQLLTSFAESTD